MREIADIPVCELMSKSVVTVRPETTLEEPNRLMGKYDFNGFPVVNDAGVLQGLVTRLDLFRLSLFPYRRFLAPLEDTWVSSVGAIMSRRVVALYADEPSIKAIALIMEHGLRTIPVVTNSTAASTLVGVVTRRDLVRALNRDQD